MYLHMVLRSDLTGADYELIDHLTSLLDTMLHYSFVEVHGL